MQRCDRFANNETLRINDIKGFGTSRVFKDRFRYYDAIGAICKERAVIKERGE